EEPEEPSLLEVSAELSRAPTPSVADDATVASELPVDEVPPPEPEPEPLPPPPPKTEEGTIFLKFIVTLIRFFLPIEISS
ncbi:unnamed protein product, partial [Nesidiocoris tenuis]